MDLRVVKTYKLLHQAFTELLEEKTFEEMTVGELCERAMIRKTTFYLHFQDKYEYFNYYLTELKEEFKSNASSKTNINNFPEYSIQMLHEMFQFAQEHKSILNNLKNSNRMSFLYQSLEKQISLEFYTILSKLDLDLSEYDLHMIVSFYSGGLINVIYWWITNPIEVDENAITQKLVDLIPLPVPKINQR